MSNIKRLCMIYFIKYIILKLDIYLDSKQRLLEVVNDNKRLMTNTTIFTKCKLSVKN
jgi:hypothetical protein